MNYGRLVLATVGGMVGYFVAGSAIFVLAPQMVNEFQKHSAIYRSQEGQMAAMPAGMAAMLVAILVVAVLYTMVYQRGSGVGQGARFGALIGLFVVCAFVLHNYMLLNIGLRLTLMQAVALAQGPAELADLRQVAIFRTSGAQRLTAVFDLAAIREGKAADPRILANDVVIIETSRGRKFLRGLRDAIPLFQMLLFF